jgi:hypothetical protein
VITHPKRTTKHICATGKQRYLSEAAAYLALLAAQNLRAGQDAEKVEQRVYLCKLCNGWHMTSKPDRKGEQ